MLKRIDPHVDFSNNYFTTDGKPVILMERDGNVVTYGLLGEEHIGTVGVDINKIGPLSFEAKIEALKTWGGGRHRDAQLGLTVGKIFKHTLCWFEGNLCVRFFKQNGRVARFARIDMTDARDIRDGTARLMYTKRTSHYEIVR